MTIKIGDLTPNQPLASARPESKGVERERRPESGGGAPSQDRVTLTETASVLGALLQSLDKVPVVDNARVAKISDQIQQGSYHVDSARIADKLLDLESQL